MSVAELEEAVTHLSPKEFAEFRAWLAAYAGEQWDKQIEEDAKAGRLDALAAEALEEHEKGRSIDL